MSSVSLALVGAGIGRSLTPAMQEREGAAQGLALTYRLLDAEVHGFGADDLGEVLTWAERFGLDGLNVTHPFKQAVLAHLDDLSETAADLGAVNTVVLRDGRRTGHNTDASGYRAALAGLLPSGTGERVTLVGAGGAGVAVGYGLLDHGVEHLDVVDTDLDRAGDCVVRLAKRFGDDRVGVARDLAASVAASSGLVNATPVGMHGHPGLPVPEPLVREDLWVSDVVYFPLETELVALARSRGCRVLPGGAMAVGQAVGAFGLFTGRAADAERVAAHFQDLTA
ncbi:shikimate dehydrogenase [Nocardioides marmoraquaticus]